MSACGQVGNIRCLNSLPVSYFPRPLILLTLRHRFRLLLCFGCTRWIYLFLKWPKWGGNLVYLRISKELNRNEIKRNASWEWAAISLLIRQRFFLWRNTATGECIARTLYSCYIVATLKRYSLYKRVLCIYFFYMTTLRQIRQTDHPFVFSCQIPFG